MNRVHLYKSRYIVFFLRSFLHFCFSCAMCKQQHQDTHLIPPPWPMPHHNLHNTRQRHRDLLFRRTSRHHQGPASYLHHLYHPYHIIASSSPFTITMDSIMILCCRPPLPDTDDEDGIFTSEPGSHRPIHMAAHGLYQEVGNKPLLLLCQIIILSNGNPLHR